MAEAPPFHSKKQNARNVCRDGIAPRATRSNSNIARLALVGTCCEHCKPLKLEAPATPVRRTSFDHGLMPLSRSRLLGMKPNATARCRLSAMS